MTEEEWVRSVECDEMIMHLRAAHSVARTKAGKRRLRLFCCACLRRVWGLLEEQGRGIIERLERVADGLEPSSTLREIDELATRRVRCTHTSHPWDNQARSAVVFAIAAIDPAPSAMIAGRSVATIRAQVLVAETPEMGHEARWKRIQEVQHAESAASAETLRDIFGNPFRPHGRRNFPAEVRGLSQAWNAGDASVLPVLIDALTDLGEEAAAAHLRQPLHVRGCHVIDWVLGRP